MVLQRISLHQWQKYERKDVLQYTGNPYKVLVPIIYHDLPKLINMNDILKFHFKWQLNLIIKVLTIKSTILKKNEFFDLSLTKATAPIILVYVQAFGSGYAT